MPLHLRAATSPARHWCGHGQAEPGCDLLTPVVGGFTEGFEAADLKGAQALLDRLG